MSDDTKDYTPSDDPKKPDGGPTDSTPANGRETPVGPDDQAAVATPDVLDRAWLADYGQAEASIKKPNANAGKKKEFTYGTSIYFDHDKPPEPLPNLLAPVAPFKPEMVPDVIARYAADEAVRMGAHIDSVVAAMVWGACALVSRRIAICPRQNDLGWTVIPNNYGMVVGKPSEKKSPAIDLVQEILGVLEDRRNADLPARLTEFNASFELQQMAVEAAVKKAKDLMGRKGRGAAVSPEELEEARADVMRERAVLDDLDNERPAEFRVITNDATREAATMLCRDNPDGIAIFRDELMGWFKAMDKKGREDERQFSLEAWTGNARFSVDRKTDGATRAKGLAISIFGGIQPGPLSQYIRDASDGGLRADGLIERFQLAVYPDPLSVKESLGEDRLPDMAARELVVEAFDALLRLSEPELREHFNDHPYRALKYIQFDQVAQRLFNEWRVKLMRAIKEDLTMPDALKGHFAKYESLVASLALVFEALDWASGHGGLGSVRERNLRRALAYCGYLRTHAMRIYGSIDETTPELAAARHFLERLQNGKPLESRVFTERDITQRKWKGINRDNVQAVLQVLEDYGWVAKMPYQDSGKGGRPSQQYAIHPNYRNAPYGG